MVIMVDMVVIVVDMMVNMVISNDCGGYDGEYCYSDDSEGYDGEDGYSDDSEGYDDEYGYSDDSEGYDGKYGIVRDIMVMIVMVVIISFVCLLIFSQVRSLLRETLPWKPQFWDRASSPSEKKHLILVSSLRKSKSCLSTEYKFFILGNSTQNFGDNSP